MPWLAPRYGGPAIIQPQSSSFMTARGHEVEFVTTNADGPGVLDVETGHLVDWNGANATFHPISHPKRYLTSWPLLADLWRRMADFDVVHIHCLYRFHTVAAAAVARRRHVPYVVQAHGSLDPWHRARRRRAKDVYHLLVEDSIIRGASAVLCTSRQEQLAIQDLGYDVPTWVISNGIEADALRDSVGPEDFPGPTVVRSDSQVVAFLGRISAKKGVDLLVESFRRTAMTFPDAHLVIAGPDDEGIGRALMPEIASTGLAARISFVGPVAGARKRALLQRAAVVVLPSADESFGNVAAEAMAVGCPVVVSPHVAIQDEIQSARAGLVAERDPGDIARAVGEILSCPDEAAAMGAAGRTLVNTKFAWPRVAAELESMYQAVIAAASHQRSLASAALESPTTGLTELRLSCPACGGALSFESSAYACVDCGHRYPVIDGIPVLVSNPEVTAHDEIEHLLGEDGHAKSGDTHKAAQAQHFDREVAEEFEIARPHGTPRLYKFLLGEKFRRATRPIGPQLVGATALTVCGGSGMDAEFLARAGAHVISSDISLGAARRTQERARRYGLDITPIVADIERLPFADASFELVLVHDGLHHLERPKTGLVEMARVARRWVSVTEPARAAATSVAVRAGVALEHEEAGNRVARLTAREVVDALSAAGFRSIVAQRYAMYYRHEPGRIFSALSRRGIFPLVRAGWRVGNALIGRAGNKLVVVAERVNE